MKSMLYNKSMDIYTAMADPTRRSILELLARDGPLSSSEIAAHYDISAPAVSQHLKTLRESKLVIMEKKAQQRLYQINLEAWTEMEQWILRISNLWKRRYDALERLLEELAQQEKEES